MRRRVALSLYVGVAGLLALPEAASAQQAAYTNVPADLRAGPAPDYPVVAELPAGLQVTVMGCVAGYSWCDVVLPDLRGWVYAGSLSYPYQGDNVPILTYGTVIGLPIVTFAIGSYWGNYYRNRPWYHDQARWANHPPPRPGPGRPPGYGYPPNHGYHPGPPPAHGEGGRPPGPPPGGGGGRPPGPPPGQGAGGGRPPGPPPGQGAGGGRPPGPPPGQGAGGGRPPGPPPGQGAGGRPPGPPPGHGAGGGRPPGPPPGQGAGGRPPGPPPGQGGGGGGSRPQGGEGGGGRPQGGGGSHGSEGHGNQPQQH